MKLFTKAYVPPEETTLIVDDLFRKWMAGDQEVRPLLPYIEPTLSDPEQVRAAIAAAVADTANGEEVYRNDVYQVHLRRIPSSRGGPVLVHLSIKRIDREAIHDWRDLQEIKNQLVGEECEGIELYPAESRKIDTSMQYHLWVVDSPTYRFPFGWDQGRVVTETTVGKSKQRALNEEDKIRNTTK